MKAEIYEMDISPHQKVQKLLPWAVHGRLNDADQVLVNLHLAECADCARALAAQRELAAAVPPPAAAPDPERAWARMEAVLDAQPVRRPPAANWWRWAAAAELLMVLGLAWRLLVVPAPDYHLLGAKGPAAANLIVSFAPGIDEARLRSSLQRHDARIVDGPTSTNAWLLAVPPAELQATAQALRMEGVATLAEPLQATP